MTIFMTFLDFRATSGLACESEGRLRPIWPKSLAAMLDYDWIYLGNLSKRRAKSAISIEDYCLTPAGENSNTIRTHPGWTTDFRSSDLSG
jgi:hypothetical protein